MSAEDPNNIVSIEDWKNAHPESKREKSTDASEGNSASITDLASHRASKKQAHESQDENEKTVIIDGIEVLKIGPQEILRNTANQLENALRVVAEIQALLEWADRQGYKLTDEMRTTLDIVVKTLEAEGYNNIAFDHYQESLDELRDSLKKAVPEHVYRSEILGAAESIQKQIIRQNYEFRNPPPTEK